MREQAAGITAFTTDDSGTVAAFALAGQLFFANLRSGTVNQLAATGPIIDPRISPDGQRIVFTSGRDGNYEIYVMRVDGSEQARLTANPERDDYPSWHPSGRQIVYVAERNGKHDLYLGDLP